MTFSIGRCLAAACGVGALWLYCTWTQYLDDFYRRQLPPEVEVGELVYADSGIRGACGGGVFALAHAKAGLGRSGIGALEGTAPAPDPAPGISEEWKETPYLYRDGESPGENYWALTVSCTLLEKGLRDTITGALNKPGSFFRS